MFIITATGNLGRDASLATTNSGKDVLNFSIGVSIGFGDNKNTEWINCKMWGSRGKKLADSLTKGTKVMVNGMGSSRTWEDKNGNTRFNIECDVRDISFVGSKKDNGGGNQSVADQAQQTSENEEDMPF